MTTVSAAIDHFLDDFATGRQSRASVETYRQGLRRFGEYLDTRTLTAAGDLGVDHALGFAKWLGRRTPAVAKATLNLYLSCVARFYRWLLRERIVRLDASDVERMREAYRDYRKGETRGLPKLPPEEAVKAVVAAARSAAPEPSKCKPEERRRHLAYLRNVAMVEALRASGMRIGELVRLRREDLDYRAHTARVTGKGSKERIVYFDAVAWAAVQDYLRSREDGASGRALGTLPVFAQHGRRAGKRVLPLTTHQARVVFERMVDLAGVESKMTPHSLRHAFATRMLDATGDLAVVQDMLGHKSPETTRIYAHVSAKKLKSAYAQAFGE